MNTSVLLVFITIYGVVKSDASHNTRNFDYDLEEDNKQHIAVNTVTKHVPYAVPQPIPQVVIKKVPYPVARPYPVAVPKPYKVRVPIRVPVTIEKPFPITVEKPYPVHVPIKVPVNIPKPYPVPVENPYPVHVPIKIPTTLPIPIHVPKPIYLKKGNKNKNIDHHGFNFEESVGDESDSDTAYNDKFDFHQGSVNAPSFKDIVNFAYKNNNNNNHEEFSIENNNNNNGYGISEHTDQYGHIDLSDSILQPNFHTNSNFDQHAALIHEGALGSLSSQYGFNLPTDENNNNKQYYNGNNGYNGNVGNNGPNGYNGNNGHNGMTLAIFKQDKNEYFNDDIIKSKRNRHRQYSENNKIKKIRIITKH